MKDDHAYSEFWQSQNSLFNGFQRYLGIFRDIDAYAATLTGPQLGGGERGEASPALYQNQKSALFLERKALIVPIFGLNFPFKM